MAQLCRCKGNNANDTGYTECGALFMHDKSECCPKCRGSHWYEIEYFPARRMSNYRIRKLRKQLTGGDKMSLESELNDPLNEDIYPPLNLPLNDPLNGPVYEDSKEGKETFFERNQKLIDRLLGDWGHEN